MARFSDAVVRQGDGLLSTLFTANYSFPEGPLLDIYGMTEPSGFSVGDQVAMPAERSGLLTLAAFLGSHAHGADSSVVHRGIEDLDSGAEHPPERLGEPERLRRRARAGAQEHARVVEEAGA